MSKRKKLYENYKHEGGFIGLPKRVFESPAYRSLKLSARCLLDELQFLYRPQRNGRIGFSVSKAAERLNLTEKTVSAAFRELEKHGFIERSLEGDYRKGIAREWRLTYEPCQGREPTDDWKAWTPE